MEARTIDEHDVRSSGARVCRAIAPIVAALAVAVLATRLLGDPPVGVADNGDGWRVMQPAGLAHRAPLGAFETRVVERTLLRLDTDFWAHPSTGPAFACLARAIPLDGAQHFDLRQLALVHLAVLVLALVAALARGLRGALVAAVPLALASPFYGDFLASFYPDASALLGVAATALALVPTRDPGATRTGSVALVIGAAILGFSSRSHAFLPALVALVVLATERLDGRRPGLLALALVLVAVLAPLHFERGTGFRFPAINHHHAVFRGIAALADDPEAVLHELGLPPASRARVGHSYFADRPDPALTRALERATPARVLVAYLARPGAAGAALERAALALDGRIRIGLRHGSRPGMRFVDPPLSVHGLRTRWLPSSAAFWVPPLALAFVASRERRRWLAPVAFLAGTLALEVLGALLAEGTFALGRHLLVAGYAFDVLILLIVALVLGEWIRVFTQRGDSRRSAEPLA